MKPNFEAMTRAELRAYVLQHRDDLDALEALFSRRDPDTQAVVFQPPQSTEEEQQQYELFKRLVHEREGHGNSVA